MAAGDVVLIGAQSLVGAGFDWWIPSEEDLNNIEPGHTNVKVRALQLESDDGGDLWDSLPVWVAVDHGNESELSGLILGGALDIDGYREGDRISFAPDRVFAIAHMLPSGAPRFDLNRAQALLGKMVLAGITTLSAEGEVLDQIQIVGTVSAFDPSRWIRLSLPNHKTYDLPPDVRSFEEARPGEYRLRSTGEVIVDPDFVCRWSSVRVSGKPIPKRGFVPKRVGRLRRGH
jgi:hypothetical protein